MRHFITYNPLDRVMNNSFLNTCFDDLNILIIGDIILDHYLMGEVHRISPEAPVPVVLHESETYRLGGAANVALNVKCMGAKPYLVSFVGEDHHGSRFIDLLEESEIDQSYIKTLASRKTTCKTRVLARNQQLLRYDYESSNWLNEQEEEKLIELVRKAITENSIDAIVFQDYNKGLLTGHVIQAVVALAKEHDIITLADPKKANFLSYKAIDWFKPNLKEVNEGLGIAISAQNPDRRDLKNSIQDLMVDLNNQYTLVTLGAKGMYCYGNNFDELVPAKERKIADVCGAGDTVISLVALGAAAQLPVKTIIKIANIAGGQVCEEVGVVPVNKAKLLKEYKGLVSE